MEDRKKENKLFIVNFEGSIYDGLTGKLVERDDNLSILEIPFPLKEIKTKVHHVCFYNFQIEKIN